MDKIFGLLLPNLVQTRLQVKRYLLQTAARHFFYLSIVSSLGYNILMITQILQSFTLFHFIGTGLQPIYLSVLMNIVPTKFMNTIPVSIRLK